MCTAVWQWQWCRSEPRLSCPFRLSRLTMARTQRQSILEPWQVHNFSPLPSSLLPFLLPPLSAPSFPLLTTISTVSVVTYFLQVTALESAEEEKAMTAISYLLNIVMAKWVWFPSPPLCFFFTPLILTTQCPPFSYRILQSSPRGVAGTLWDGC